MKNLYFTVVILLITLSSNLNAQNNEFVIFDNQGKNNCFAYKVEQKQISSLLYVYKKTENPKYSQKLAKLDSLKTYNNNIEKLILDSETEQSLSKAKNHLQQAINQSQKAISTKSITSFGSDLAKSAGKWRDIKIAKENLDKTNLQFVQNTNGKYKIAIEQAENNLKIIFQLENRNDSLKRLLTLNNLAYNSIKNKYVDEKIMDYVPTETITRDIIQVDHDSILINTGEIFSPVIDSYSLMLNDFLHFKKWELVPSDTIENYRKHSSTSQNMKYLRLDKYDYSSKYNKQYLFYNIKTNQIYYTKNNLLEVCAVEKDLYDISKFLRKSGGDIYYEDDQIMVELRGKKCILTPIVKKELVNKNISIIDKMASSVNQHKIYKNQASKLADEMAKYLSAYKSHLLTSDQRAKWETATLKCDRLIKKMSELPFANEREYYTQTSNENKVGNKYSSIVDITLLSKRLLGL